MEYAFKYQQNLKGLLICNMMASCPEYGQYADEVLAKQMDPKVLAEVRAIEAKKRFLKYALHGVTHPKLLRETSLSLPCIGMPDPVNRSFKHMNSTVYMIMQGPSEFGIAGKLEKWDIKAQLPNKNNFVIPFIII